MKAWLVREFGPPIDVLGCDEVMPLSQVRAKSRSPWRRSRSIQRHRRNPGRYRTCWSAAVHPRDGVLGRVRAAGAG